MALLRHTVFSLPSHSFSLSLLSRIFFLIFLLVRFNFLRASFRTRYLFSLDSFTFILRFLIFSSVSSLSYRFLSFFFIFSSPTFPYASSFSLFFSFFFFHTRASHLRPIFPLFFATHIFFLSLSLLKSYLYLSRKWRYCFSLCSSIPSLFLLSWPIRAEFFW